MTIHHIASTNLTKVVVFRWSALVPQVFRAFQYINLTYLYLFSSNSHLGKQSTT